MFTKKELSAIAHALGNVLCQKDHPDREILLIVREKIRVAKLDLKPTELFMAAKLALDILPPGPIRDRLIDALLPTPCLVCDGGGCPECFKGES